MGIFSELEVAKESDSRNSILNFASTQSSKCLLISHATSTKQKMLYEDQYKLAKVGEYTF